MVAQERHRDVVVAAPLAGQRHQPGARLLRGSGGYGRAKLLVFHQAVQTVARKRQDVAGPQRERPWLDVHAAGRTPQGAQQQVAVLMAARLPGADQSRPHLLHHCRVVFGHAEHRATAHQIQAAVADVRDGSATAVDGDGGAGGSHPVGARTAQRANGLVGAGERFPQRFPRWTGMAEVLPAYGLHRQCAGEFSGVVPAHAVGHHGQRSMGSAQRGVFRCFQPHAVLVDLPPAAGVGCHGGLKHRPAWSRARETVRPGKFAHGRLPGYCITLVVPMSSMP